MAHNELLLGDGEVVILLLDFFLCLLVDFEQLCVYLSEQWPLVLVNLLGYVLAHVNNVASTLVCAIVTKGCLEHFLFELHRDLVVVELPPLLLDPIVDIGEVVTLFSHTIVYHDGMQVERPLLGADVGLLESVFHLLDLLSHSLDLVLCLLLHLSEGFECNFKLLL